MARITKGTFLMDGGAASGSASWTTSELVKITNYPDLDQTPEGADVTTLSDPTHVYIENLPDPGDGYDFDTWLSATDGAAIDALRGVKRHLAIWIGGVEDGGSITPSGIVLKVTFTGYVSYQVTGAGTAEAQPARVHVTVASSPTKEWGTDSTTLAAINGFSTAAGSNAGDSKLTVPAVTVTGGKYYFKAQTSAAPAAPALGEKMNVTGWTQVTNNQVVSTTNGYKYRAVELNAYGQAIATTDGTVVAKT